MKIRKWFGIPAVILAGALIISACGASTNTDSTPNAGAGQAKESGQAQNQLQIYENGQPLPVFNYSEYRQTLISIEATQALGIQTTSFFFNMGNTSPVYECPSLGQAIPNTAQLSNPSVPVWQDGTYNNGYAIAGVTIGQIDPNGTYSPSSSTGTNVECVNNAGQKYLVYWEGFVLTINGSATWNPNTHAVEVTGAPSMPVCKQVTGANGKTQTVCTK